VFFADKKITIYGNAIWLAEEMANTLLTDIEYKKNKEWILNVW
jgi:nitrogenase molybdenum-iron protein beta chain